MPDTTNADARFAACLNVVLKQEGGYADNPADPGGATNMGITRRTLAAWRKVSPWTALSKTEVQALTRAEAAKIYHANYWEAVRGDDLPAGLDLALFDFAVNSGPARAVKSLQAVLKLKADGIFGPLTLGAIRSARAGELITKLCDSRLGFLVRLASFATFGRGWRSRVAIIKAAALQMAGVRSPASSTSGSNPQMPTAVLAGYRTYIVAALMVLVALAELAGISMPAMDGQSAGHLLMEAFAIIFLRKGIENAGKA